MKTFLVVVLLTASLLAFSEGNSLTARKDPSPCGDWAPFKDEKCIKVVNRAGLQTHEDAEVVCRSFNKELKGNSTSKLVTIKSKEEQVFLQQYLFVQNNIVDNVWIGLKESDTDKEFKWNDGTSVEYSNWADQSTSDANHKCVQMESGDGNFEAGLWVKGNCMKRFVVVCERRLSITWTLDTLQNAFLSYREESMKRIRHLENNPVPSGFIYVQLPGQQTPSVVWPQVNWKDVSSEYEGLFFRVVGGDAAPFNEMQHDFAPVVDEALFHLEIGIGDVPVSIPADGSWSPNIVTGGYSGTWSSMSFKRKAGEVRPRNKAVMVWQRS